MFDYKLLFEQTKDMSLLIVEDYTPLRHELVEVLKDFFKIVISAADGQEALSLYNEYYQIHKRGFDLVISDIQMPHMNGIELTDALKSIDSNQEIMILSAHTDSDYLLELLNIGISQFVVKPIDYDEFLTMLLSVTKKKNALPTESKKSIKDVRVVNLGEDFYWDRENFVLKHKEEIIELTRHEIYLLELLIDSKSVVSNDDITRFFYSKNVDLSENSIRNLIFKLRKKLPSKIISSIYAMGYKLILQEQTES